MTLVMLLVLLWALVLVPSAWRSRRDNPEVTVGGFHRAMDVLRDRPPGRHVMVPSDPARIVGTSDGRRSRVLEARRRTFARLAAVAGVSVLAGVIVGGRAWLVAGVALAALGGYVALLLQWKQQRAEAAEVVRDLTPPASRDLPLGDRVIELGAEPLARAVGASWVPATERDAIGDRPITGSSVRIRRWDD